MAEAPARLTTREVAQLARLSVATIRVRVRDGRLPPPVDRGRENLFDRQQVERALGLQEHEPNQSQKIANGLARLRAETQGAHYERS